METTIKRKSTIYKMKKLFNSNAINIRFYQATKEINRCDTSIGVNDEMYFNMTVRHCENQTANNIYKDATK